MQVIIRLNDKESDEYIVLEFENNESDKDTVIMKFIAPNNQVEGIFNIQEIKNALKKICTKG